MFWRTTTKKEIDYIEVYKNNKRAFEFKLNELAALKGKKLFTESYPDIPVKQINPQNFFDFVNEI